MDSTEEREISTTIPISEIPFIMRALGYYPTEQEVGYYGAFQEKSPTLNHPLLFGDLGGSVMSKADN